MRRVILVVCLAATAVSSASAVSGALLPYTADAATLHLYHFDEAAGTSIASNSGSVGGNALTVQESATTLGSSASSTGVVTTMLGAAAYPGLGSAVSVAKPVPVSPATYAVGNQGIGFDASNNGAYSQAGGSSTLSQDALPTGAFSGYFSGGSYTLEAMVNLQAINTPWSTGQRDIISFESNVTTSRSIYLRIDAGALQLGNAGSFRSFAIPTAGPDAFTPGEWFHAAVTHDASTQETKFYWTRADPSRTQASLLTTFFGPQVPQNLAGRPNLMIGSDSRQSLNESLGGLIDEVRISSVARGPGEFLVPEPSALLALAPLAVLATSRRRRRAVGE